MGFRIKNWVLLMVLAEKYFCRNRYVPWLQFESSLRNVISGWNDTLMQLIFFHTQSNTDHPFDQTMSYNVHSAKASLPSFAMMSKATVKSRPFCVKSEKLKFWLQSIDKKQIFETRRSTFFTLERLWNLQRLNRKWKSDIFGCLLNC